MARTMFEKIWDAHVVLERADGQTLLYVDRHLCHDGSFNGFATLHAKGLKLRRPDLTWGSPDHYRPTDARSLSDIKEPELANKIALFEKNATEAGIHHYGLDSEKMGIVHVIGPDLGITLPGILLVCGDSHTATHGALGAFAFGIGASEIAHVFASQTLWQRKPKSLRITVDGPVGFGVGGKDVILAIIARISAAGAAGHVVEYAGSGITALSMEERMTVCNMTIEAGGRAGMIAPDAATFAYCKGREFAPKGEKWDRALAYWKTLPSDPDAVFDKEVALNGADIAPMVTWGTSPEYASPVTGIVPDPAEQSDPARQKTAAAALDYMGITAGTPIVDIAVDQVYIGSCTNGRIDDMRAAAAVARGRQAVVAARVVPGSEQVRRQAEAEGLDRIFIDAGFEWRFPGCATCVGLNDEVFAPGTRAASTSNRNFMGRQGPGVRTHLVGPAMAAAAAVTGHFTDVRKLMKE